MSSGPKLEPTVQFDGILNELSQTDRDILINQKFRILKDVLLQNWSEIKEINMPKKKCRKEKKLINRTKKSQRPSFSNGWSFERKFANKQLALEFLQIDWKVNRKKLYKVIEGRKVHYRCTQAKQSKLPCGAEKCLFYPFGSNEVSLYKKNEEHTNHSDYTDIAASTEVSKNSILSETLSFNTNLEDELIKVEIDDDIKVKIEWDSTEEKFETHSLLPENAIVTQTAPSIDENVRNSSLSSPEQVWNKNLFLNTQRYRENDRPPDYSTEIRTPESILKEELIIEDVLDATSTENETTAIPETKDTTNYPRIPQYFFKQKFINIREAMSKLRLGTNQWSFICSKRKKGRNGFEIYHYFKCNYNSDREIRKCQRILVHGWKVHGVLCYESYQQPLDVTMMEKEIPIKDALNSDTLSDTDWSFYREFDNYTLAHKYLQSINLTSFIWVKEKSANKQYYRCNLMKGSVQHCPASRYIQQNVDLSNTILLYTRNIRHVDICSNAPSSVRVLNVIAGNVISAMVDCGNNDESITTKTWLLEKDFQSFEEATTYLTKQCIWSYKNQIKFEDDHLTFYQCNAVLNSECPAAKYVQIKNSTNIVSLYKTEQSHIHNTVERHFPEFEAFRTLDVATKFKIQKLIWADCTPQRILEVLKLNKFPLTFQQQLCDGIQIMQQYKGVNHTSFRPNQTIAIKNWLSQIGDVPNSCDEHEPYCVSFSINQKNNFRCFLSTRCLLRNAITFNSIHLDSSQVLFWRRKPISVIGATELNKKFHLFGISVSLKLDQSDYEFIFQAIQKGVAECHNQLFKPQHIICDDNENIYNAGSNVFGGDCKIGTSPRAALYRLNSYLTNCDCDNGMKTQIRQDMLKIFQLNSRTLFLEATKLFFEKWQPWAEEPLNTFLNRFKMVWVDRVSNWFEVFPHFTPNTSKGIQLEYDALRKNETLKPRFSTFRFIDMLMNDVENLSSAYATNGPKIIDKVPITLAVYTKAYEWKNLTRPYKIVEDSFESRYYFSTGTENLICEEAFQNYQTNHPSLDDFFNAYSKFVCVVRCKSTGEFSCDCKTFWSYLMCKHSVGMALILKA